jgi:hypothetical protein
MAENESIHIKEDEDTIIKNQMEKMVHSYDKEELTRATSIFVPPRSIPIAH